MSIRPVGLVLFYLCLYLCRFNIWLYLIRPLLQAALSSLSNVCCSLTYSANLYPLLPASKFESFLMLAPSLLILLTCQKASVHSYIKGYPLTYSLQVYPGYSVCFYLHLHVLMYIYVCICM